MHFAQRIQAYLCVAYDSDSSVYFSEYHALIGIFLKKEELFLYKLRTESICIMYMYFLCSHAASTLQWTKRRLLW
jgi:hypothetical protein